MKIGDLVMYKEGVPFGLKRGEEDIGLIVKAYSIELTTQPKPLAIVHVIWQRDGFDQSFSADIAKDRIEVVR